MPVTSRGGRHALLSFLAALSVGLSAQNARAEPSERAVQGLIHDLEKIVELQTSIGWKIDRYEYDKMMPDALQSLCRTSDDVHFAALTELDETIEGLGGPPEERFRLTGSMKGLDEVLYESRVRALLLEGIRRAPDECPFWIEVEPNFKGIQTDAHRFTISAEGGGLFALQRVNGGTYEFGGGGSGRLFLGYGLNQHWTVLLGLELGGLAIFDQTEAGTNFPLQFTGAMPIVARRLNISWHYDFELAPLAFATQSERSPVFGVRGGFLIGVSTLRIRKVMPWAGVGTAIEYIFPVSSRPGMAVLKAGARVGFDYDF